MQKAPHTGFLCPPGCIQLPPLHRLSLPVTAGMSRLKSHSTDRETEAQALPLSLRPPVFRAEGWVPSYCPPRLVVLSLSLSLPGPPGLQMLLLLQKTII